LYRRGSSSPTFADDTTTLSLPIVSLLKDQLGGLEDESVHHNLITLVGKKKKMIAEHNQWIARIEKNQ